MKTILPLALVMCAFGTMASRDASAQIPRWCYDAGNRSEARVCDSNMLSRLDRQLNRAYQRAMATGDSPRRIRSEQRSWLAARDRCRGRRGCLEGMYRSRIAELRSE